MEEKFLKFNEILNKYNEEFGWPFQDIEENTENTDLFIDESFANKLIEEFGSLDIINDVLREALKTK